jgi:hypothetical protein
MRRSAGAHVLALLAALVVVIAVSAAWIVHLRLGPRLDGLIVGPMIIVVPLGILLLIGMWGTIRWAARGRIHWTAWTVFGATLAMSAIVTAGYCGPIACFAPGNNRLVGWFLVAGATLAALAHHLVLNVLSGERSHAVKT